MPLHGYSVEADVRFGALDRKGREQLVCYCLRPAIAHERLSILKDGSIAYLCKYPTRGKSHRVMQPAEFLARLAAIVPSSKTIWTRGEACGPGWTTPHGVGFAACRRSLIDPIAMS